MQKMNGRYEDAKKTFSDYLKASLDKSDQSYKALAKIEIDGCDTALVLLKTPTKIKVEKTEGGVNTTIQDFSPKPLKNNRILFSSQKTDTAVNVTTTTADHYSAIFTAEKSGTTFSSRTMLPVPPNDSKTHTGNAVLSADENTLVYTKCDQSPLIRMNCKLYSSKKEGSEWKNPTELTGLNSATANTTHPSWGVDADGNSILYFASDRGEIGRASCRERV